jgi:hypothetical protein
MYDPVYRTEISHAADSTTNSDRSNFHRHSRRQDRLPVAVRELHGDVLPDVQFLLGHFFNVKAREVIRSYDTHLLPCEVHTDT